jgi:hypothetical protein
MASSKIHAPTPKELGAKVASDHTDTLRQESEKITTKINEAYEKLASKLRGKADKAKASMDAKKDDRKRALLRRRFELYADAANDLEMRLADRRRSRIADSD